jgi:hypothetical protein
MGPGKPIGAKRRLLYECLEPLGLILPPDLGLAWASPGWRGDGVTLMFQRVIRAPRPEVRQQMLRLTSTLDGPDQAAEDMARRLLSVPPDEWVNSFGQHMPGFPTVVGPREPPGY